MPKYLTYPYARWLPWISFNRFVTWFITLIEAALDLSVDCDGVRSLLLMNVLFAQHLNIYICIALHPRCESYGVNYHWLSKIKYFFYLPASYIDKNLSICWIIGFTSPIHWQTKLHILFEVITPPLKRNSLDFPHAAYSKFAFFEFGENGLTVFQVLHTMCYFFECGKLLKIVQVWFIKYQFIMGRFKLNAHCNSLWIK